MASKPPKKPTSARRPRNTRSTTIGPDFVQRVVIKFDDRVQLEYRDHVGETLTDLGVGSWQQLGARFPGISIKRLITSVTPERIAALVETAVRRDASYVPPNFLSYFAIEYPTGIDPRELAAVLRLWGAVEMAYPDPHGSDPHANAADDPRSPNQGYLDAKPDGVDAEFAWNFRGGDGEGQSVVDLEQGWTLDHEDLAAHNPTLLHGTNLDSSRPHGTSVLGEMCAVDNTVGCIGIAHNVASVDVVSYHGSNRPSALFAAIDALPFGGVLLIEAQVSQGVLDDLPIEVLAAEFDAIRLATALGVTVVEAAGNGNNNLDTLVDGMGRQTLNRSSTDFKDSGAVMVSAATSTHPHRPLEFNGVAPPVRIGNFGSRIDCYGWGENIDTSSSTTTAPFALDRYTSNFALTSGASPIVAGAALAIQGIAEFNLGYRLSPTLVRSLLSNPDPAVNTPSNDPLNDRIGVLPNLRAIIESDVIAVAPDVYLRDFVGDTGDPHSGAICSSPDVILLAAAVANPQLAFGEGSNTENTNDLGSQAQAGQDNVIYVRVRNRGGSDAPNVIATVYWSPPATLVTPNLWTLVGQVTIPLVSSGNVLTVSDAVVWPAADVPPTGHYCLVALLGTAAHPAPVPSAFPTWSSYETFIRNNNDVTWHNFNVVDSATLDASGFVEMNFFATGPPWEGREMSLDVVARLPQGSRAFLEFPLSMYEMVRVRVPAERVEGRDAVRVPVNPYGLRSLGTMLFSANAKIPLTLLVSIPEQRRGDAYEVFVRQMHQDVEVGRITWRLAPRRASPERSQPFRARA